MDADELLHKEAARENLRDSRVKLRRGRGLEGIVLERETRIRGGESRDYYVVKKASISKERTGRDSRDYRLNI